MGFFFDVMRRPPSEALRAAMKELTASAEAAAGHSMLSDALRLSLESRTADLVVVATSEEHDGKIAGFAVGSTVGEDWALATVVAPGSRYGIGLSTDLLDTALVAADETGAGPVLVWASSPDEAWDQRMGQRGFQRQRDILQMRRSLPAGPEEGPRVPVRTFRPDEDEERWIAVNNRVFTGHPDQGNWSVTHLRLRESEPWFDPAGFLLYESEGRIAAFCWTKVPDANELVGEIYVIGVDPDLRGSGKGRSIALAGLDHLARVGCSMAMLYVDSDSTAALALYQSLGFRSHHLDRAYLRP